MSANKWRKRSLVIKSLYYLKELVTIFLIKCFCNPLRQKACRNSGLMLFLLSQGISFSNLIASSKFISDLLARKYWD
jgi:hypothetical protein